MATPPPPNPPGGALLQDFVTGHYRELGLPTSSVPVESQIKQFNRRVKGSEKFWTAEGAEAVLQVRVAYLSQDGRADRNWALPRPHYRAVGRNRLALIK